MMRSKYRHVAGALVGALSLVACGDDSAATPDTDASSSSAGDDSLDTTITTDPSSGTAPGTESSGAMTTADSSGDGSICVIKPQIFEDPSFENGSSTPWGTASSLFDTPLCDAGCGGPTASDGSWFVWIGGDPGGTQTDVAGVAQAVTINTGDEATLKLAIWYGAPVTGDIFQILVDGTVVFELDDTNAAEYTAWTEVEIDVSPYADGSSHEFDFTGSIGGGGSFYFDNVRLESCDAGSAATAGDSVDPPMTGGTDPTGETDSETGSGLEMCDDDIADPLPVTQAGNNGGAGNEVTGACTTGGSNTGEDVAYSFTAPATGAYAMDTLGSELSDTVLYVLEDCMGGPEIACNDDISNDDFRSSLVVGLTEGQTVAIVVDGYDGGATGDFVLNIRQLVCEAPTDLGNTVPIELDDDNTGAIDDVSASCGGGGGEDVIYTWTAPEEGIYAVYAVSLEMSPVVAGFSGSCGNPNDEIGCGAGANFASFNAALAADQEISIVVDAQGGSVGSYELDIDPVGTLSGDCCAADDSAGCEDLAITQCVCGALPGCCSDEWSDVCAGYASSSCAAGCATVDGGSCCEAMGDGDAGCDVAAIEDCVCGFDGFCCGNTWDANCVDEAVTYCFAECG